MAHPRTFRFGVQASGASSAADWRDFAAQDRGPRVLDAVHARPLRRHRLAPMVGIAFAAEATTTLRVGHLVLGNDYKHPAIVAKETATIDLLSDGRRRVRPRRRVDAAPTTTRSDCRTTARATRIARLDEALAGHQGIAAGPRPVRLRG